jgi:hypothetical protein
VGRASVTSAVPGLLPLSLILEFEEDGSGAVHEQAPMTIARVSTHAVFLPNLLKFISLAVRPSDLSELNHVTSSAINLWKPHAAEFIFKPLLTDFFS